MHQAKPQRTLVRDLTSGMVVFLVALPLCLGVALASNAPLFAGLVAGIVGGILVGCLSGSHTSVSGPAAGLTAVVAAQIVGLGSYQTFLLAVVIAGLIQSVLGIARAGFIAAFFPSSVIKGLLAAIGVILILKQIPHLFGHDSDPEGDMAFDQPDHENTFSELGELFFDMHPGAAAIGLTAMALLMTWDRVKFLKKSIVPAPLIAVMLGVGLNLLFQQLGGRWTIEDQHLVQVPIAKDFPALLQFLTFPDFSQWKNPAVYTAGITIALVASLETLLNLEAVDKLDPHRRTSPASRELLAQGIGNVTSGLLGGLPVTSVVIRSSVNINAGGQTKLATIVHGLLLLVCVILLPKVLNQIPLSCLAAILLVTGLKLVSPAIIKQMWNDGRYQFIPFAVTVVAIVMTDLLIGILVGMGVSVAFILNSNLRRPVRRFVERHLGGDVLHIVLSEQVTFLNRAALDKVLDHVPPGGQVLLDAQNTDYIDPDVLDLIREYRTKTAPTRGIAVSMFGFRDKYHLHDEITYVDHATRGLQSSLTPVEVLQILKDGHARFLKGQRLTRDLGRQVHATAQGQHPLAVVLGCIDSRSPAELIFDLGVGDIFSVRVAGNISSRKVLGSMEYGCAVAGAKLILVMGHTRCGAVTTAVELACSPDPASQLTGCQHISHILNDIKDAIDPDKCRLIDRLSKEEKEAFVTDVARANVIRTVNRIVDDSETIRNLVREGRIAVVGAMYDVGTGGMTFLNEVQAELSVSEPAVGIP